MMRSNPIRRLFNLMLVLAALGASADVTIEVTGTGAQQLPVAIAGFNGEAGVATPLSPVIRADLDRSGRFKLVDAGSAAPAADGPPSDLASWKTRGADALAIGDLHPEADGGAIIRMRLYDTLSGKLITGVQMRARPDDLRRAGHQLADVIYEALTGERGVFETRIAFVVKKGKRYELQVADADGYNAQMVFGSNEPIMSPTWASDGRRLAYVSFERQKPIVFVQ
ncbi:MAG: PD40 domain-containing protein, partial [Burkholderiaceae bacterium]|nr:PD40 domain-containing protein [Burkholderiaceae bacterium]